jgi:hypothetical protein
MQISPSPVISDSVDYLLGIPTPSQHVKNTSQRHPKFTKCVWVYISIKNNKNNPKVIVIAVKHTTQFVFHIFSAQ